MRRQLLPALRMLLVLTVLTGLLYPLALTGIGQTLFGDQADGSLVTDADGNVVGSSLIGQAFDGDEWFQGRPSAAGDGYDPTSSGSSNLGPTNPELLDTVAERVAAYREANGLDDDTPVPVDAVTASGSGLDPQISVANARLQAARVAEARGLTEAQVDDLIDVHTRGRALGFLGEPGVDVLQLNLALADPT
jgi:K+-transporting ATPase ATPase C chain